MLDRLLDADPDAPEAASPSAAEALERLHLAVRRDVEALLNARRRRVPVPAMLNELPTSIYSYGIPDPASGAYAIPELRAALVREVEATIRRFEPRLTRVTVSMVGKDDGLGGTLRMKVDAVLRADPVPEPISFETLLEPVTRDVTVREA
jgi:type VI secretion system protein ImpF